MNLIQSVLSTLFSAAKESPGIVLFVVTTGFLAFMLYESVFIANQGAQVFLLYVILAVCALVMLLALIILSRKE